MATGFKPMVASGLLGKPEATEKRETERFQVPGGVPVLGGFNPRTMESMRTALGPTREEHRLPFDVVDERTPDGRWRRVINDHLPERPRAPHGTPNEVCERNVAVTSPGQRRFQHTQAAIHDEPNVPLKDAPKWERLEGTTQTRLRVSVGSIGRGNSEPMT